MVLMEKDELRRIEKEDRLKPQPEHDLSLVPYFISRPLPGHGIDEVAKNFKNKYTPYQYNDVRYAISVTKIVKVLFMQN